jgi:hypothetical protein
MLLVLPYKIRRIIMKMAKGFLALLVLVSLFSCKGTDGNAQLKYWWAGSLSYLSDTNPSTPSTVYNDVYFHTNPGKYYLQYRSFDNSFWYTNYEITINKGAFLLAGDDLWFEMGLYSAGPTLYKWTSPRSVQETEIPEENTGNNISQAQNSTGLKQGPIIGREERKTEFGTIKIEYGRLIE